ncbi:MAG: Copper-sensing transcriptional repressor CsoR [Firmicutes bacterium]|nr:Copper-sensing transcriptional repressor CsoR [Bacillota bacterium]
MQAPHDDILRRLRKIEGQVRGLQRMVGEDRYCLDILTQVAAVRAALDRVGMKVLDAHARGCLATAIRSGQADESIDELVVALERFMR